MNKDRLQKKAAKVMEELKLLSPKSGDVVVYRGNLTIARELAEQVAKYWPVKTIFLALRPEDDLTLLNEEAMAKFGWKRIDA